MSEIVVLGDDFWNTYGIIRGLGESGLRTCFINVHSGRSFVRHSRYIKKYWQVASAAEALDTLEKNFGDFTQKTIVLCSNDELVGAVDANLNRLSKRFITFNCHGRQGEINRLMGKDAMLELARETGLLVPKTVSVDLSNPSGLNLDALTAQMVYPCITKSENSNDGGKDNLARCNNAEELRVAVKGAIDRGCHRIQIQEFIEKEYEILITGCADGKGNVVVPGVITKLSEYPMGYTALARIEPETEKYIDPELIKRYVRLAGFSGIFSVEFLLSKGKMYFMEINLRNDGNSYASTPGGVNIHRIWVDAMRGNDMAEAQQVIDKSYDFQVEANALNNHVLGGKGYGAFLKEFIKVDFRLICNIRDPKPALYRFLLNKF